MSLASLIMKLDRMGDNSDKAFERGLGVVLKKIQRDAKKLAPTNTGRLRNSIVTNVKKENSELVGSVSTNVEYAPYMEFGTGPVGQANKPNVPIPIRYKQDKWLAKIPNVGFRYVSGVKPRPFLYPAFLRNKKNIEQDIAKSLRKDIKEMMLR